jgi:tRNA(Arg) A34 adenosine deaminase TadA
MQDKDYLRRALELAAESPEPVGCGVVIVADGQVVAETFSSQRKDNMAIYHAEVKAVMEANRKTGSRKLPHATAYCSCEPCAMCLTALSYANVERIIFYKRMIDFFPDDPQSRLDPYKFVAGLNFVPKLQQLSLD